MKRCFYLLCFFLLFLVFNLKGNETNNENMVEDNVIEGDRSLEDLGGNRYLLDQYVVIGNIFDNVFDLDGIWVEGRFVNSPEYKATSKYYPIPNGQVIYIRSNKEQIANLVLVLYDEDKRYIENIGCSTLGNKEIPSNARWFRLYKGAQEENEYLYVSTVVPKEPVDYTVKLYKYEDLTDLAEAINNMSTVDYSMITIVNFGDSIYGNIQDDTSVSSYISEMTGCNVINAGFGGCQVHQHHIATYTPFSLYKIVDSIVSGDWSEQEAAIATDANLPYYFGNTLENLKSINWEKVDIVTISYGTNDWSCGDPLISSTGDLKDTNTLGGALRYSLEKLYQNYPQMRIYVQSPIVRFEIENGVIIESSDTALNAAGNTLVDFVELEESICKEYKTPFIDAYYDMGFNEYTHHYFYNSKDDGVHLNARGRKKLAEKMVKAIFH